MGLDMYLSTADGAEAGYWRKANAIHGWFVRELADGVDECQPIQVSKEDLLRLREACATALTNRHQAVPVAESSRSRSFEVQEGVNPLEQLYEMMKMETTLAVMEKQFEDETDPLRPTAGFFFGGTEKDEWYYQDLEETITIIDEALAGGETKFVYQASW